MARGFRAASSTDRLQCWTAPVWRSAGVATAAYVRLGPSGRGGGEQDTGAEALLSPAVMLASPGCPLEALLMLGAGAEPSDAVMRMCAAASGASHAGPASLVRAPSQRLGMGVLGAARWVRAVRRACAAIRGEEEAAGKGDSGMHASQQLANLVIELSQAVAGSRAALEVAVQLRLCGVLAAELARLAATAGRPTGGSRTKQEDARPGLVGVPWTSGRLLDACCALTESCRPSRVLHAVCLRGILGNWSLWGRSEPLVVGAWSRRVGDLADRDVDAPRKLLGWDY